MLSTNNKLTLLDRVDFRGQDFIYTYLPISKLLQYLRYTLTLQLYHKVLYECILCVFEKPADRQGSRGVDSMPNVCIGNF